MLILVKNTATGIMSLNVVKSDAWNVTEPNHVLYLWHPTGAQRNEFPASRLVTPRWSR